MSRGAPRESPVLFLHGAFSRGEHLQGWAERFAAAGYTCSTPSRPGHAPSDPELLRRLTLRDFLAAAQECRSRMPAPPIIVGHSMGGLLGQQLAASGPCAALVLLASAPPGRVVPLVPAVPYLMPMVPPFLAGRPFRPTAAAFRWLGVHDLPPAEQSELFATIGYESGRAYRAMVFGTRDVRVGDVPCPVLSITGGADRMIAARISRAVAARYRATQIVLRGAGHWVIAPSAAGKTSALALDWLACQ